MYHFFGAGPETKLHTKSLLSNHFFGNFGNFGFFVVHTKTSIHLTVGDKYTVVDVYLNFGK